MYLSAPARAQPTPRPVGSQQLWRTRGQGLTPGQTQRPITQLEQAILNCGAVRTLVLPSLISRRVGFGILSLLVPRNAVNVALVPAAQHGPGRHERLDAMASGSVESALPPPGVDPTTYLPCAASRIAWSLESPSVWWFAVDHSGTSRSGMEVTAI